MSDLKYLMSLFCRRFEAGPDGLANIKSITTNLSVSRFPSSEDIFLLCFFELELDENVPDAFPITIQALNPFGQPIGTVHNNLLLAATPQGIARGTLIVHYEEFIVDQAGTFSFEIISNNSVQGRAYLEVDIHEP